MLPALHFLDDLAGAELAAALALADGDECLLALEIVEYNPDRDAGFVTARASHDLCCSLIDVAQEHLDHLQHIAHLRAAALRLDTLEAPARAGALHTLYLDLSLFVADNLRHMHVEETEHNAALWCAYTDDELRAIHGALVGTIPPGEMMSVMRWMLPQMNAPERLAVLGGMRQEAPETVFRAVLDVVQPHLAPRDWAKLSGGLGLPAVPGLVAAV